MKLSDNESYSCRTDTFFLTAYLWTPEEYNAKNKTSKYKIRKLRKKKINPKFYSLQTAIMLKEGPYLFSNMNVIIFFTEVQILFFYLSKVINNEWLRRNMFSLIIRIFIYFSRIINFLINRRCIIIDTSW